MLPRVPKRPTRSTPLPRWSNRLSLCELRDFMKWRHPQLFLRTSLLFYLPFDPRLKYHRWLSLDVSKQRDFRQMLSKFSCHHGVSVLERDMLGRGWPGHPDAHYVDGVPLQLLRQYCFYFRPNYWKMEIWSVGPLQFTNLQSRKPMIRLVQQHWVNSL